MNGEPCGDYAVMFTDTDPAAERVQIESARKLTAGEKVAQARSLSALVIGLSRRAIARAHPHLSPQELEVKFVELHYGKALAQGFAEYLEERRL